MVMLERVRQRADEFDILHFHIDFLHAPLTRVFRSPAVTTHHGRLDLPDLPAFYDVFNELPLVAISNDQRKYLPHVNWVGTVHHGLPRDLLPFAAKPSGGYLAFLGRISPEKRPDLAIEIAVRAGMPLKIAAKIDRVDRDYWEDKIKPMVETHANVEFVGEISEAEKGKFLGDAQATLFPVDWPEPFGLVVIESMACGTPVIAFPRGSVPEILEHGTSGFIVEGIEQAVAAVERTAMLDRAQVRAAFERRFTVERMARDYLRIYRGVLADRSEAARDRRAQSRAQDRAQELPGMTDFVGRAAPRAVARASFELKGTCNSDRVPS